MKYLIKAIAILPVILLFITPIAALAGGGAPPGTPIDGGLSLLLVAGGAYGAKKLMDSRRNRS